MALYLFFLASLTQKLLDLHSVLEGGDIVEACGFALEDLQRHPCKHDKFFDQLLTSNGKAAPIYAVAFSRD